MNSVLENSAEEPKRGASPDHQYAVAIVGKGVAGLLLSRFLTEKGISNCLLTPENAKTSPVLSETLPPSTLTLLHDLNLLEEFEVCSKKLFGYQSKWKSDHIHDEDFFRHNPFKYGLKLNKPSLLTHLENSTDASEWYFSGQPQFNVGQNQVEIRIKGKDKDNSQCDTTIRSQYLVDASGRNRAVLKALNVPVQNHDKNVAYLGCFKNTGPHLKYGFFTESFDGGWGTVSTQTDDKVLLSLYLSRDSHIHNAAKKVHNWQQILQDTYALQHFLTDKPETRLQGVQANSSIAKVLTGERWLAVGDAAMTFDPLSSHGTSNAIFFAMRASETIQNALRGDANALYSYQQLCQQIYQQYLTSLHQYA